MAPPACSPRIPKSEVTLDGCSKVKEAHGTDVSQCLALIYPSNQYLGATVQGYLGIWCPDQAWKKMLLLTCIFCMWIFELGWGCGAKAVTAPLEVKNRLDMSTGLFFLKSANILSWVDHIVTPCDRPVSTCHNHLNPAIPDPRCCHTILHDLHALDSRNRAQPDLNNQTPEPWLETKKNQPYLHWDTEPQPQHLTSNPCQNQPPTLILPWMLTHICQHAGQYCHDSRFYWRSLQGSFEYCQTQQQDFWFGRKKMWHLKNNCWTWRPSPVERKMGQVGWISERI